MSIADRPTTVMERSTLPTSPSAQPSNLIAPAKGFAVTALVTGIVGTVFGLIPLFAPIALATGIVAVVFGLIAARRNKRNGHPVGISRTGWILGSVAVILGVVGFAIVSNAVDDLNEDLDRIEQDWNR